MEALARSILLKRPDVDDIDVEPTVALLRRWLDFSLPVPPGPYFRVPVVEDNASFLLRDHSEPSDLPPDPLELPTGRLWAIFRVLRILAEGG